MQHFLSAIANTGYVPECTGLHKIAIINFSNFLRYEVMRDQQEVITAVRSICEEMLKDETLSPLFRKDLEDYSTITCGALLISMTSHEFKTVWNIRGGKNEKDWKDVMPRYLHEIFGLVGEILKDNVKKVCARDQERAKGVFYYYYGAPDEIPVREQVAYEWKSVTTKLTIALMMDGKIGEDLCKKTSLMFINEPPVTPTSTKVDAKWRDYVETYFGMIMKKNFDPEFVGRVAKEAYLESRK